MFKSRRVAWKQVGSIWMIMLFLLTACANVNQETPDAGLTAQPEAAGTTAALTEEAAQASPAAASTPTLAPEPGVTFRNPVLTLDFPDPFILPDGGRFYAYATNSAGRNIQLAVSEDLVSWDILTDAMPALPDWASLRSGLVWAPEVIQVGKQYLLYYTARDKESDRQCIGVAVSDSPEGKFRDSRAEPLVCQVDEGGSIDASPFRDGETLYLLWKNDGNCCGIKTWIYSQELAPDGLSLVGEPVRLIENDEVWEGTLVEAPTLFKHEDRYYLFFSANNYASERYAVGYALCDSPSGPCQDAPENPILASLLANPPVIGPGHQTLLQLGEQTWMIYHAWEVSLQGLRTDRRQVWIDRLDWVDGKPVVRGPTTGVQPVPEIPQPAETTRP